MNSINDLTQESSIISFAL